MSLLKNIQKAGNLFKDMKRLRKSDFNISREKFSSGINNSMKLENTSLSTIADPQFSLLKSSSKSKEKINFKTKIKSHIMSSPLTKTSQNSIFFKFKKDTRSYLSKVKSEFKKELEKIGHSRSKERTGRTHISVSKRDSWFLNSSQYSQRSKSPTFKKFQFSKKSSLNCCNTSTYSKKSQFDDALKMSQTQNSIVNHEQKGDLQNLFSILTKKKKIEEKIFRTQEKISPRLRTPKVERGQKIEAIKLARMVKNMKGNCEKKFEILKPRSFKTRQKGQKKGERKKKSKILNFFNTQKKTDRKLKRGENQKKEYPKSEIETVLRYVRNLEKKDFSGINVNERNQLLELAKIVNNKFGDS